MSLNDVPSGERLHIAFFGCRNAGKSSVVNAVTGQSLSVVSPYKGTTTDPVSKAMEILPLGPVVIIDTPGIDDEGDLGSLRTARARETLSRTDIAVLVTDATQPSGPWEEQLKAAFAERKIPWIHVHNKCDLLENRPDSTSTDVWTSALNGTGIRELKETLAHVLRPRAAEQRLVGDLVRPGQFAVLVIPIDSSAPKGRLILPQQQVIRDLLDVNARIVVVQAEELKGAISRLTEPPALVITDSQAFGRVSADTPQSVPLTSFSILMARYKGFLEEAVRGFSAVSRLKDGDTVLISEGCTHHRQCADIGTVKIPFWLKEYTGRDLRFETVSGTEFPEDCTPYSLVICCGGCMLSPREVQSRIHRAVLQHVPATNYGVLIGGLHGILRRALGIFPHLLPLLDSDLRELKASPQKADAQTGFSVSRSVSAASQPEENAGGGDLFSDLLKEVKPGQDIGTLPPDRSQASENLARALAAVEKACSGARAADASPFSAEGRGVSLTALRLACMDGLTALQQACVALQNSLKKEKPAAADDASGTFAQAFARDCRRLGQAQERLGIVCFDGQAGREGDVQALNALRELTERPLELAASAEEFKLNFDIFAEVSGLLKIMAVNLSRTADYVRVSALPPGLDHLPSSMRRVTATTYEQHFPIPEMIMRCTLRVIDNDSGICAAIARQEDGDRDVLSCIAGRLLESLAFVSWSADALAEKCLRADESRGR